MTQKQTKEESPLLDRSARCTTVLAAELASIADENIPQTSSNALTLLANGCIRTLLSSVAPCLRESLKVYLGLEPSSHLDKNPSILSPVRRLVFSTQEHVMVRCLVELPTSIRAGGYEVVQ